MKSLIIIVLTVALIGCAWMTRPREEDFDAMVRRHMMRAEKGSGAEAQATADKYLATCEFYDRGLWVEVRREGHPAYIGALAHWFDCAMVDRNLSMGDQRLTTTRSHAPREGPSRGA